MKSLLLLIMIGLSFHLHAVAQTELRDKRDIAFATHVRNYDGTYVDTLRFDIYYPTGAMSNKKYPVYFSLHGGSFVGSTKKGVTDISDAFADYGFIVIAPDYRVGYYGSDVACGPGDDSTNLQEAIYRAVQDVNACIRYVNNHAGAYNVDTSWIFVGGSSAGGTLTLNDAYLNDSVCAIYYPHSVATMGTLQTSGNSEPYRYKLKGLLPMWGGMPVYDGLINAKSAIPSILFKGAKDDNLPNGTGYYQNCTSQSVIRAGSGIYDIMTALGVPSVYHFQPNAAHIAYDDAFCIDNASCFFKALINGSPYSGYYQYYKSSCK